MNTHTTTVETRLAALEHTNARWRGLAIAGVAGIVGLLVGGAGSSSSASESHYVATDDTIYRIGGRGQVEYIRFEDGLRSPDGYFNWGEVKIDRTRRYPLKPQP